MILVCRRERKRSERGEKKKVSPSLGEVGEEAVIGFWLYHNKNSPDPP